jgi:hypothetical protein
MFSVCASVMLSGVLITADPANPETSLDAAVDSYERLATVIIEVRRTEDSVVKTILAHHHQAAQEHLQAAAASEEGRGKKLEAAAAEIVNLANEGDKRVQAIRQRLAKAGHTHISDADTKEDYLWVNSKEKKGLLAAAKSIAQLGDKATKDQINAAAKDLETQYNKAIAPE